MSNSKHGHGIKTHHSVSMKQDLEFCLDALSYKKSGRTFIRRPNTVSTDFIVSWSSTSVKILHA